MRAVDWALAAALALASASTVRALPRFDDGEDIYVEDPLQRLDPAGRSKKSVEASGPDANEFLPVKLKNGGDAKGEKKSAGVSSNFGPPVAVVKSKSEGGAEETKKEADVDGSRKSIDAVPEGSGAPVDGGDWPRRPRQNFADPPALTMSYSPDFRTFGAAGVTSEQSDAERQAALAAGGAQGKCDKHDKHGGVGGGIGGVAGGAGAGAGAYVHPPSPLKQLKQLVPNIISAITAILPPPAAPTPPAGPGSGPGDGGSGLGPGLGPGIGGSGLAPGLGGSGLGPGLGGPGPGPGHSTAGHMQYGATPHKGGGLIFSKRIIMLPPGGAGFGHGLRIEDYPELAPASRFPVYPELPPPPPPPPPPAFDAPYPPPVFVDAAGRVWAFGYPPAQRPLFAAPGQDPAPEAAPERPAEELSARSAEGGPPASVARLRADVDAELARIEALERAMNPPAAAEKDS